MRIEGTPPILNVVKIPTLGLVRNFFIESCTQGEKGKIVLDLDRKMPVTITIYDREGNSLRTLVDETMGPCQCTQEWDGRNAKGELVASGYYNVLVQVENNFSKQRMLVIK